MLVETSTTYSLDDTFDDVHVSVMDSGGILIHLGREQRCLIRMRPRLAIALMKLLEEIYCAKETAEKCQCK
jgi:hypothetical protein